ncbi:MAG: efflux RND transporter periplasmic adaptor subunit, partial [Halanaerobiales bacterium]
QIELTVNEDVIVNLEEGMEVGVTVPGLDKKLTGSISYVAVALDDDRGGFPLEIKLDLPGKQFKSGMYAAVELPEKKTEGVVVPRKAVFSDGLDEFVYTIDKEKRAVKKKVETGIQTEKFQEITDGVEEGEKVVTDGLNMLSDGDPVEVIADENF